MDDVRILEERVRKSFSFIKKGERLRGKLLIILCIVLDIFACRVSILKCRLYIFLNLTYVRP